MSTREQPGYPPSQRTGQGQPVLPRRQLAAEQEHLRRLQQQAYRAGRGQGSRQPRQQQTNTDEEMSNEEEYDDVWPARLPTSTRRYNVPADQTTWEYMQGNRKYIFHQGPPPVRQAPPQIPSPTQQPRQAAYSEGPQARSRVHWMLIFGIGMLAMLALWVLGSMLLHWWSETQDDWHYGRPRSYQTDAVVGHNDSSTNPSHFLALNLNRHVVIIELPGGDPSKAKIYTGPPLLGDGQDLTPVTLSFKDVNGDGLPDMLVHVQEQTFVMINDSGQFRPARPGEHVTL
jgi:hypothetical protein